MSYIGNYYPNESEDYFTKCFFVSPQVFAGVPGALAFLALLANAQYKSTTGLHIALLLYERATISRVGSILGDKNAFI